MMAITALTAGRELDALVAERVMGWLVTWQADCTRHSQQPFKQDTHPPDGVQWIGMRIPDYSTSIVAAWSVVEKLCALKFGCNISFRPDLVDDLKWRCVCVGWHGEEMITFDGVADTAPFSICLAALKWAESQ